MNFTLYSYAYHDNTKMRKTAKRPSEWLRLLCRDWAVENDGILDTCDQKFVEFKPYMKGILTSQLLCRLTIPATDGSASVDFLNVLGVEDEFDKVGEFIIITSLIFETRHGTH
jgi:hypothetical protein